MRPTPGWRPARRSKSPRREVDDELQFHIEGRIAELRARGMAANAARTKAYEQFGDVVGVRASCIALHRTKNIQPGRPFNMRLFIQDFRYAIRALVKRPGYTASVVATLALAVGATTSVFSVVNGVLLRPLPIPNPQQVVRVWEVDQRPGFFDDKNKVTVANYGDWQDENRVFDVMAAFQQYPITLRDDGDPRHIMAAFVSAEFFEVLGMRAATGRTFLPEEDSPDAQQIVVISDRFWKRRLGSAPDVLERTLGIGSDVYPVVGVLPPSFDQLDQGIDVLMPLGLRPNQFDNRRSHTINVIARIKPGNSVYDAQQDMDRIVDGLRPLHPQFLEGWGVNVQSLTDAIVGDIRPALLVLQAGVIVLLIIATVNVTNIMLARTMAEQRELAIRTALGAGRSRLIAQKLGEAATLASVGGMLGVLLAYAMTGVLLTFSPDSLPMVDQVGISGPVLAFALAVTALAALAFALAPALRASRPNLSHALKTRNATVDRRHHRFRAGLVVAQLAFSLTLLISAGLLVKTFIRLMQVDPGFRVTGIATAKITLPFRSYPTSVDQAAFYDRILEQVRMRPGVTSAGATKFLPMVDEEWTWSVQIEGQPERLDGEKRDYGRHAVMPGYFEAMDITLRQGRLINDFDRVDNPPVALVNEAFVGRFFPAGGNAVGSRMMIIGEEDWIEIVGVVGDVHHYTLDADPQPAYYAPLVQFPDDFGFGIAMNVVLRTDGNPVGALNATHNAVRELDPSVALSEKSTMVDHVAASVARSRFAMTLLSTFALIAAALAAVGVYGVVSYSVGQRTQEIGVRLALGARGPSIVTDIVGSAVKLAFAGVAIGIVTAIFVTRFQASLLFNVSTIDPMTYGGLAVTLVLVAGGAAFFPAYRASRTDPMRVLREE